MRIKDGYMLRSIGGTYIVVPVAERVIEFKGMITLNEVSAKIWEFMAVDREYDEIVELVLSIFDTDIETVKRDLDALLKQMEDNGVLVDERTE